MTSTTFLSELERLKAAATEGPWRVDPDDRPGMSWNNHICVAGKPWTICFMAHEPKDNSGQQAAAELICLLRNHADAIAEVVRAATSAHQTLANEGFHAKALRLGNALANLEKEKS